MPARQRSGMLRAPRADALALSADILKASPVQCLEQRCVCLDILHKSRPGWAADFATSFVGHHCMLEAPPYARPRVVVFSEMIEDPNLVLGCSTHSEAPNADAIVVVRPNIKVDKKDILASESALVLDVVQDRSTVLERGSGHR